MEGGSVAGVVDVVAARGSTLAPAFVWTGGTLPTSSPSPQVTTYDTNVRITSSTLSGALWVVDARSSPVRLGLASLSMYARFFPAHWLAPH